MAQLTGRQAKATIGYLRYLANELGLRDWTFTLKREFLPGDQGASVTCTYGRKWATIRLGSDWLDISPDEQRDRLVHELIHCHFDASFTLIEDQEIAQLIGKPAATILEAATRQPMEFAVDGLAMAIGWRFDPPPDLSKPAKKAKR